jgi:hypothetical protein
MPMPSQIFGGTGVSDCVLGGNISGSSFDEYVWNDPNGVLDLRQGGIERPSTLLR